MNRRNFLGAAAIAAQRSDRSWAANDKVSLAIIGVGGRGSSHLGDFIRRKDVNLAAVCDVDTGQTEAAVQKYYAAKNIKPKVYQDLRKLYEDKSVDAVMIGTPNHWHALAAIWACQAGKDVYVEKPVSHNIFEGEQMVAAARKYNRIVQVGTQSRSIAHRSGTRSNCCTTAVSARSTWPGPVLQAAPVHRHKPDEPVPPGVD